MKESELTQRLARYRQIKITVSVGSRGDRSRFLSGSSWRARTFIHLPVQGSGTQSYRNVLKNPSIRIDARGAEAEFRAVPMTEAKTVQSVVEKFREKYGAKDVNKYYSKFDVAVVNWCNSTFRAVALS